MPSRTYNTQDYKYGYNGMEKDKEIKGDGNSYTTEFRQYDPRLGRWLSLDPLMAELEEWSPYVAFENNPVLYNDPLGLKAEGFGDRRKEKQRREYSSADDYGWTKAEAKHYKHRYKTGGTVKKQKDGSYAIVKKHTLIREASWNEMKTSDRIIGLDRDKMSVSDILINGRVLKLRYGNQRVLPEGTGWDKFNQFFFGSYRQYTDEYGRTHNVDGWGRVKNVPVGGVGPDISRSGVNGIKLLFNLAKNPKSSLQGLRHLKGLLTPNRLHHIFGQAKHELKPLIKLFGSEEAAYRAVQIAADEALAAGKIIPLADGTLDKVGVILNVGGMEVRLIGGKVVNGQVLISSFSRKGL